MIYQCYAREEDRKSLFRDGPYQGFGLEPGVNTRLFENCPELQNPETRIGLTEYACFLWHWRNQENPDDWFGSTSFRQLEKGFVTKFQDGAEVERLVQKHRIVAWGQYRLLGVMDTEQGKTRGFPISLAAQAEACHPGINDFISSAFRQFNYEVPGAWRSSDTGFFANYWAMGNQLFSEFMEFSWPLVQWSLDNVQASAFYQAQPVLNSITAAKSTGYFMERLFILWYLMKEITPQSPYQDPRPLFCSVREGMAGNQ